MISVIIVNYNSGPLLRECVQALRRSDLTQPLEIIVVDNASTDGSLDRIENREDMTGAPPMTIIRHGENRGFAAACNDGLRVAKGDFMLFLNPDCIVATDALEITARVLAADPGAGAAGGLILNPDGTEQRGCRRDFPDLKSSIVRLLGLSRLFPGKFQDFNRTNAPLPVEPTPVNAISGAYLMIERRVVDHVGPWDEGYFLHVEDLDWCKRIQLKGYRILFIPEARIIHHQGACSAGRPVRVEWHKHRGMWRFYRKFQAADDFVLMRGLVAMGIAMNFLFKALALNLSKLRPQRNPS